MIEYSCNLDAEDRINTSRSSYKSKDQARYNKKYLGAIQESRTDFLVPREWLNIFFDDPDGHMVVSDYLNKIVELLYEKSRKQYLDLQMGYSLDRLQLRKKIYDKVYILMPNYSERQKSWESYQIEKLAKALQRPEEEEDF